MEKIRVGISDYTMSPLGQLTDSANTLNVLSLFSEPLVRSYDGKIWPALAQSWQVFDEGRRWLFYLRPNAFFHDNTPCTMVDALDCIEAAKTQTDVYGMPGPYGRYFKDKEAHALNRLTLEVICEKPSGDVGDIFSGIMIRKKNRDGDAVIGTGNYVFANYNRGKTVRLVKKPGLKHLSAYEQITFFIIPDPVDRLEALAKGDIHVASNLDQMRKIPEEGKYTWGKCANIHTVAFLLNAFNEPFSNPAARLAVNYAVDQAELIDSVLHGWGVPAATVVSPYHCGFDRTIKPIPYDPDKAKKIFDKINMPNKLTMRSPTEFPDHAVEVSEFVANELKKVGIDIEMIVEPDRRAYAHQVGDKDIRDMALFSSCPNSTFRVLSDKVSSVDRGNWWMGFDDEETQKLIEQANAEDDITDRERKYSAALHHLNHTPPWIYLYHPISVFACIPEVKDVEWLHTGMLRFPGSW